MFPTFLPQAAKLQLKKLGASESEESLVTGDVFLKAPPVMPWGAGADTEEFMEGQAGPEEETVPADLPSNPHSLPPTEPGQMEVEERVDLVTPQKGLATQGSPGTVPSTSPGSPAKTSSPDAPTEYSSTIDPYMECTWLFENPDLYLQMPTMSTYSLLRVLFPRFFRCDPTPIYVFRHPRSSTCIRMRVSILHLMG